MKLTKMAASYGTFLCDSSEYCTEMICDYVKKNAENICDKTLVKLAENLCESYSYESEIGVFAKYFFNMGLIVAILGYLFVDTNRTERHYVRVQNYCDRIDEIFEEINGENSTKRNANNKRKDVNVEIKKRFFNSWKSVKKTNQNVSNSFDVGPTTRANWRCEFDNVVKVIPYWANIFKLKRTEHYPELCETQSETINSCEWDWKLAYDEVLKELVYDNVLKELVCSVFLKEVSREASARNYRRFCRLSKIQNKLTENRTELEKLQRRIVHEINKRNVVKRYQEFIENFKEDSSEDNGFVTVERPGWGWFGF